MFLLRNIEFNLKKFFFTAFLFFIIILTKSFSLEYSLSRIVKITNPVSSYVYSSLNKRFCSDSSVSKPCIESDVVIIGGGPAGISSALSISKKSNLKVCVIDNNDNKFHVGEIVNSSITGILDYLGNSKVLNKSLIAESAGFASTWGGGDIVERDAIFNPHSRNLHLDREKFNQQLRESLSSFPQIKLLFPYTVKEVTKKDSLFFFKTTEANKSTINIKSRFLIDSSGRRATFSKQLGSKDIIVDRLIGISRHYRYQPFKGSLPYTVLTEPVENGWWYSALLPNSKLIVTFMCDTGLLQNIKVYKLPVWEELLENTKFTKQRLSLCEKWDGDQFKLSSALSHCLEKSGGEGWVAAGDAACSFDPLSSMGIGHALSSGIRSGIIACQQLIDNKDFTDIYSNDVHANFSSYMNMRKMFYQSEKRWQDNNFWKSRVSQEE